MNIIPISYKTIEQKFDESLYHIGYLTHDDIIKMMNFPIKLRPTCTAQTRDIYFTNYYGIIVIKHTLDYDYTVEEDMCNYLLEIPNIAFIGNIDYLPLKVAQILAGTGQYGKNQLVYDYKFGFETHIGMAIIKNKLIDLPKRNPPNWNFLSQCDGCDDCKNACPVKALHNDDTPPWVDWVACNMFNRYGDHPIIPSMKWGWGKYVINTPLSDDVLRSIQNDQDFYEITGEKIIPSTIETNGIIKHIQYPICRECACQPKCSVFNGCYPYDKDRVKIY